MEVRFTPTNVEIFRENLQREIPPEMGYRSCLEFNRLAQHYPAQRVKAAAELVPADSESTCGFPGTEFLCG
jgi:hypothetical protein